MTRIDGRIVLLTGAANGIGACTAAYLARSGARLVMSDIDATAGTRLAAELADQGAEVTFMPQDVGSEPDWRRVIDAVATRYGGLDVLVNNAGIVLIKSIMKTSLEEWREVQRVNVEGVFLGMKYAVPVMIGRAKAAVAGGAIVNLSSVVGMVGVPNALAYSMSKAAVRHMTKSAAMEFAEAGYNIRVNSIHPGLIKTGMSDRIYGAWAQSGALGTHDLAETEQIAVRMHPLGRHGQPEDIARGVLYLASDESSWMTGAELVIDGGFIAR